jgi:hypothetical protein
MGSQDKYFLEGFQYQISSFCADNSKTSNCKFDLPLLKIIFRSPLQNGNFDPEIHSRKAACHFENASTESRL